MWGTGVGGLWKVCAILVFLAVQHCQSERMWAGRVKGTYQRRLDNTRSVDFGGVKVGYGAALDVSYFLPEPREVVGLIQRVKPPRKYKAEVYDCDDFARWFQAELARQWANAGGRAPIAIATICAIIEAPDGSVFGHAFNGIVMSGGRLVLIEPQGPVVVSGRWKIIKVDNIVF